MGYDQVVSRRTPTHTIAALSLLSFCYTSSIIHSSRSTRMQLFNLIITWHARTVRHAAGYLYCYRTPASHTASLSLGHHLERVVRCRLGVTHARFRVWAFPSTLPERNMSPIGSRALATAALGIRMAWQDRCFLHGLWWKRQGNNETTSNEHAMMLKHGIWFNQTKIGNRNSLHRHFVS